MTQATEHPLMRTVNRILQAVVGSPCQLAEGKVDDRGYPRATVKGKQNRTHVLAWEKHHGPRPDKSVVRHLCGDKRCVNVKHLELGTKAQNKGDETALAIAIRLVGENLPLFQEVMRGWHEQRTNGDDAWEGRGLPDHPIIESALLIQLDDCSGKKRLSN